MCPGALKQELYQFAVENIFRALEHAFENLAQQQREKDFIRQSKFFANELELSLHGKPAVRVSQTIKDKSCTFTGVYNFHEDARHQLLILDSPKSGVGFTHSSFTHKNSYGNQWSI